LPTTWSGSLLAIVSRHSVIPATGRPPQPPPLNLPMTLPRRGPTVRVTAPLTRTQ
jgi:hypothetical protein